MSFQNGAITESKLVDSIESIAESLYGDEDLEGANGDRLRVALAKIAYFFKTHSVDAELPEVTAADNGSVLKVVSGKWAKADEGELPAVTADNNGAVLRVSGGQWAIGSVPGVVANQADTTSELGDVVTSFNALLAAMKAAGVMEADS